MPEARDIRDIVQRVAVTVPSRNWFHGIDLDPVLALPQGPRGHEAGSFRCPAGPIYSARCDAPPSPTGGPCGLPPATGHRPAARPARSPVPHACRTGRLRPNVFTELLDLPTICQWDHAPLELAVQILPPAEAPLSSKPGAAGALRRVLAHPRMLHWSRDSGQTRLMQQVGFATADRVVLENSPALPGFRPRRESPRRELDLSGTSMRSPICIPIQHSTRSPKTRSTTGGAFRAVHSGMSYKPGSPRWPAICAAFLRSTPARATSGILCTA